MSWRTAAVRGLPALLVTGVLAAALVSVTRPAEERTPATGSPAVVEKRPVEIVEPDRRVEYTQQQAAAVAIDDPAAPQVTSGVVVAELETHDLPEFELLGVTWTHGITAGVSEVQVRWRQDGVWSSWTRLEIDAQEVSGGIPGTEPRWVGVSDAAQARIVSAQPVAPTGLQLVTVSPGEMPTTTPAALAQPGIISRAAWGADESGTCDEPRYGSSMQGSIVHHTAGSNVYTAAQSAGIVKAAQAYHMNGQKWCDIGYNFLVDRYGQVFEGRRGGITSIPRGAHSGNGPVNTNTTGVALMGHFVNDVPPEAMKNALVNLLAWKHSIHGVAVKGTYSWGGVTLQRIDGHYSVVGTACPGQQVINWMNAPGGLRDQVQAAVTSGHTVSGRIGDFWTANGGSGGSIGAPTSPQTAVAGGVVQRFANADLFLRDGGSVVPVRGSIRTEYRTVGEAASGLGWPTGPEYSITGGAYQDFVGGRIFAKPEYGTFAIAAPMYAAHESVGNVFGQLGWPIARAVRSGAGSLQRFAQGSVYAAGGARVGTPVPGELDTAYRAAGGPDALGFPTGSVETDRVGRHLALASGWLQQIGTEVLLVRGAVGATYLRSGGVDGTLGAPTAAERQVGDGFVQTFQKGWIVVSPVAIATLDSVVARTYEAAGGGTGPLGWPVSGKIDEPGGYRQDFQSGSIHVSGSTGEVVRGAVRATYRAAGGAAAVGQPTGPERRVTGGYVQPFAKGGVFLPDDGRPGFTLTGPVWTAFAALGSSADTLWGFPQASSSGVGSGASLRRFSAAEVYSVSSGTAVVRGYLRTMYLGFGAHVGRLGLPTGSEQAVADGFVQRFAGGALYVSPVGAAPTWGALGAEYQRRGGPTGPLGWPLGAEVVGDGIWTQKFQRGTLVLTSAGFSVR